MRNVYRYILPGSANHSLLHTIGANDVNPEFSGRKAADQDWVDGISSTISAISKEILARWVSLKCHEPITDAGAVLADKSDLGRLAKEYETFSRNLLADLEDALASKMNLNQYDGILDKVVAGWPFKKFTHRLFRNRRETTFVSQSYYIEVMAAAAGVTNDFIHSLKRYCPAHGVPCGWDSGSRLIHLHQVKL